MTMSLARGFADPVFDAQRAFRAVMDAMARPGTIHPLGLGAPLDAPLPPAATAIVLALCDFETPLWLSPAVAARPGVADHLRFHAGAPMAETRDAAAFALIDLAREGFEPAAFAQGLPDYPDRSTTVIGIVERLEGGPRRFLAGPGIAKLGEISAPLPADFPVRWAENRARFPMGVDLVLAAPEAIIALPRTTRILGEMG